MSAYPALETPGYFQASLRDVFDDVSWVEKWLAPGCAPGIAVASSPDQKNHGSNLLIILNQSLARVRSTVNLTKILNRKNLAAKYWIDWV
jgi:hypothetical protein